METLSAAELVTRGVRIEPDEAVAIIQQLIHQPPEHQIHARAPFGPPDVDNVQIRSNGDVVCTASDVTPAVSEMAILLQALIGNADTMPPGIAATIARALHEVDKPPFDSLGDFSAALAPCEHGDRRQVVRRLLQRASPSRVAASQPVRVAERRLSPAIVSELRRELREADRVAFAQRSRRPRVAAAFAGIAAAIALVASVTLSHRYREQPRPFTNPVAETVPIAPKEPSVVSATHVKRLPVTARPEARRPGADQRTSAAVRVRHTAHAPQRTDAKPRRRGFRLFGIPIVPGAN